MQAKLFAIAILSVLLVGLIVVTQRNTAPKELVKGAPSDQGSEITQIKQTNNLDEQVIFYKKLITRVGPERAQEELYRSGLPFDGQTHLLNHTVGDVLYERHGTSGLRYCKDYFLSSCYHGFVIHAVGKGGFAALVGVMEKCWEAGYHVAIQCSHAIGHGVLAWVGYAHLTDALKRCDELSTRSKNFPLYNCQDGVFMENIWAVHETGKPSKDRWLKDDDHLYPCNDPRILYVYRNACWSNQPMRLYQLFGGDVRRVGFVCLGILDETHKKTCFDGLARQIHPLTKGSVDETFRLCRLMPEGQIAPCITSVALAAFSVGDRNVPFETCSRLSESEKGLCFDRLVTMIQSYISNQSKRKQVCKNIPLAYSEKCTH